MKCWHLALCWQPIRNGRLDEITNHGVRGIQSPLRVDDRIVFEAASLSKPVFAYLVLRLVDRGELKLEVPLNNYIPNYIADDPCSRSITVEHVLSHSSGLANWRSRDYPLQRCWCSSSWAWAAQALFGRRTSARIEPIHITPSARQHCHRPSVRIAILPQARTAGHFLAHGMPYGARVVSSTCSPPVVMIPARDNFLTRMKSSSVNRINNIAKACR